MSAIQIVNLNSMVFFTSFGSGAASILNIVCGFVSSRRIVLVLN